MFLYPIGFIIVILLGAIAVDLSNVWLQQRRLADAADSAANDAAAFGLDQDALRGSGIIALDPDRVAAVVRVSIAGQDLPPEVGLPSVTLGVSASGNPTVTVSLSSNADLIFGRAVRSDGLGISATGTAELVSGP
jgi:Flp pilus assembly protein TadG